MEEITLVSAAGGSSDEVSSGGAEIDRLAFRGYDTKTPDTMRSGEGGRSAEGVRWLLGALGGNGLTSRLLLLAAILRRSSATLLASLT